ncbi:arylacetamide deacetylase-like 4 [Paroedura picta]|uniref:arylacetamide deacetylase-like 4 n=1 Tax=Paroedura picta TaxID=143630 RepID=UPI0040572317
MSLLWDLLWLASAVLAVGICLLLAWAICYQFLTTEVPPGICQPLKIRVLHMVASMGFALDYIFWMAGLCKAFTIWRILIDGIPPMADPSLLIKNEYFDNVRVRVYKAKRPSPEKRKGIVFFHGGGGIFGSIDAYERVCRYIAKKTDAVVVSVGYHLAPEYQYPTQFKECLSATTFFMKTAEKYGVDPTQVIISGDSFGGTLAAYVVQKLVKRPQVPRPRAQILIGPCIQSLDFNLPSYQQNHFVPIVPCRVFLLFASWYLADSTTVLEYLYKDLFTPEDAMTKCQKWLHLDRIPEEFQMKKPCQEISALPSPACNIDFLIKNLYKSTFSPLLNEKDIFPHLPDAFILTSEFDLLRDDGLLYKKRLEDNGVQVTWRHLKDGFHGVLYFFNHWFLAFPCSAVAVDHIVGYIKRL